jgi:hypothetical protein
MIFWIIPMIIIAIVVNAIYPWFYLPSMLIGVAFASFCIPIIIVRGLNERAKQKAKRDQD